MFVMVMLVAIAVNFTSFGVAASEVVDPNGSGPIVAAIVAAAASVANTLILTRVRKVQDDVGGQVQIIKRHAEQFADTDRDRDQQIQTLRELSRERARQIAEMQVIADRLGGHVDHLEGRQHRFRSGDTPPRGVK